MMQAVLLDNNRMINICLMDYRGSPCDAISQEVTVATTKDTALTTLDMTYTHNTKTDGTDDRQDGRNRSWPHSVTYILGSSLRC